MFDGERIMPTAETVLVEGGCIVDVQSRAMPLPQGCELVAFPDATLLPGLIDTHVHLCGDGGLGALDRLPTFSDEQMTAVIEDSLRAHLACGVTTVRDLGD
ncbi:MAG: amidohydrolase family protein [Pseudonocardiales bacterium]|nr:amidohydrolase family protein [Pseudonocardiales bacterium]